MVQNQQSSTKEEFGNISNNHQPNFVPMDIGPDHCLEANTKAWYFVIHFNISEPYKS